MIWKRFAPGTKPRCRCGQTTFFQGARSLVTWVRPINKTRGVALASAPTRPDAHIGLCKRCGEHEIVSAAEGADEPPAVAA